MRAFLSGLMPLAIIFLCSIGGCSAGLGIGYVALGDNVHNSLVGTVLLSVVFAAAGFVVGSILASQYVGRKSARL